jgi:uroporphyrinogen-III synthase
MQETKRDFAGLRVVAFESRHTEAMARLISNNGGQPFVAPSMREVPLSQNDQALEFAAELFGGRIDMVIFLTGVGTRILTKTIETKYTRDEWLAALSKAILVARGPKPVAALSELGLTPHVRAPEPNTWHELVAALDGSDYKLEGLRIAVQEYGATNAELLDALRSRGALVRRVPLYQWDLPLDTSPLKEAAGLIADGKSDVALFTTSVQVVHLIRIAAELGRDADLLKSLQRMLVASIGPTTSEMLREYGITPDLEPSHPKMAALVKETAERSSDLLLEKRRLTK